jgi:anti-anti-sigma factor
MGETDDSYVAEAQIETSTDTTGTSTVKVSGDLDLSNVDALKATIATVTADRPDRLVFDLSGLRFMDSAAIAVLVDSTELVPAVHIQDPSPSVKRMIEITGVTAVLSVDP